MLSHHIYVQFWMCAVIVSFAFWYTEMIIGLIQRLCCARDLAYEKEGRDD